MIDYFAIGLTHGLLALAALRLLARADLDSDTPAEARRRPWQDSQPESQGASDDA